MLRHSRTLLAASDKPADAMFCASTFATVTDALRTQPGFKVLKTYVVRSVTLEPILPFFATEAVLSNYVLDLQVGGYGSYAEELLNPHSRSRSSNPTLSS